MRLLQLIGLSGAILVLVSSACASAPSQTKSEAAALRVSSTTPVGVASAEGESSATTISTAIATSGESDEVDDVTGCSIDGQEYFNYSVIELVNNSSKASNYLISLAFLNKERQRVGDDLVFISHVRPGEAVRWSSLLYDTDNESAEFCEVRSVERTASWDNTFDISSGNASCELSGEDFAGHAEFRIEARNTSDSTKDLIVTAAVIDSSVTVDHMVVMLAGVSPNEIAPDTASTSVPFDPDLKCEVLTVSGL